MKDVIEREEIKKIEGSIATQINDLGIAAEERQGQDVKYLYGQINGLIFAYNLILKALEEDL